ncbi:hypothetical protein HYALB_00002908 [Hymenoscyphus albidus]|uniref:Dockerin type 1 n=1 Tax=Hymenoscyphus albidus TaxID=595503 RepID=A0A9N9QCX2_9HELO|nr:hypothetical protein HYALB_00002908 [Hymenoscyphus albidus]
MLQEPRITTLGQDPRSRTYRINANSFQQNAITTINGWQYAVYYTEEIEEDGRNVCFVNLSRRKIDGGAGTWERLTFRDYEQTADDGHNTISVGVCRGDGSIHLAFDHHCDQLRYRVTKLKDGNGDDSWSISCFTETQDFLPGLESSEVIKEVSYPRFLNVDEDLLLTYRIGQAGEGSDVLYRYSSITHKYTYLGQYLTGIKNNPYVNGFDYRLNRVHISWCYRNFVAFESTDPNAHKQQAGPNGPCNNHDLNYAYSDDVGKTWKASNGEVLASIQGNEIFNGRNSILPSANGIRVFDIPMGSGILNQEGQVADWDGGFWALNRESVTRPAESGLSGEEEHWMVYHRDIAGKWTKKTIQHSSKTTETGSRAKICVDRESNVYLVLPGNSDSSLGVLQSQKSEGYARFEKIWTGDGYDGEPLVDVQMLEVSNLLSIFTRTSGKVRDVVVLDFVLA